MFSIRGKSMSRRARRLLSAGAGPALVVLVGGQSVPGNHRGLWQDEPHVPVVVPAHKEATVEFLPQPTGAKPKSWPRSKSRRGSNSSKNRYETLPTS